MQQAPTLRVLSIIALLLGIAVSIYTLTKAFGHGTAASILGAASSVTMLVMLATVLLLLGTLLRIKPRHKRGNSNCRLRFEAHFGPTHRQRDNRWIQSSDWVGITHLCGHHLHMGTGMGSLAPFSRAPMFTLQRVDTSSSYALPTLHQLHVLEHEAIKPYEHSPEGVKAGKRRAASLKLSRKRCYDT